MRPNIIKIIFKNNLKYLYLTSKMNSNESIKYFGIQILNFNQFKFLQIQREIQYSSINSHAVGIDF